MDVANSKGEIDSGNVKLLVMNSNGRGEAGLFFLKRKSCFCLGPQIFHLKIGNFNPSTFFEASNSTFNY